MLNYFIFCNYLDLDLEVLRKLYISLGFLVLVFDKGLSIFDKLIFIIMGIIF